MRGDIVFFVIILSTQRHAITATTTEEPVGIETRIELLKREIFDEIEHNAKQPHKSRANIFSDHYSDMYEYIDESNRPITPIPEFDKRKLKNRFKMPEIRSTTTDRYIPSDTSMDAKDDGKPLTNLRHKPMVKTYKVSKPKDVFYRKMIFDDEERNKPQKWTHCLDLITPYLNGYKDNMNSKHVQANDSTIIRLAQLLSIDVKESTKEDIRSILYQISNLQLRIYQWDVKAIKTIFNVIVKTPPHNFKTLKHGLKEIFSRWKLDTSDTVTLLKQSRIFRPPCIQVSEFSGSTLTPKIVRYTKSKPTKCPESEGDDCST